METFSLIEAFLFITSPLLVASQDCIVTTSDGTIHGQTQTIWKPPREICSYTAIPYASPPVGELRFKAPTPPAPFGFLNATSKPNLCPQTRGDREDGYEISEDCLYLNVYVPKSSQLNLPVIVWLHGGEFTGGSSKMFIPDKLLSRGDIILVVPHYRVGVLGFLNTQNSNSPGNYGLKDQSFAIRWVKNNIASFGGSPEKITVAGEAAGASSAMYQLISPLNKGLINAVISQGGTALTLRAFDDTPLESAKTIASYLNCTTITTNEMVDCLRNTSWKLIEKAQTEVNYRHRGESYQLTTAAIVPSIEPDLPGAFITKHPLEIMEKGEFDKIPVIIGANKHSGDFMLSFYYYQNIIGWPGKHENPEYFKYKLIPDFLRLFRVKDDAGNRAVAASIEMTYLHGVNRSDLVEIMPRLVDFVSVFGYKSSALHSADLLSKRGHKVYLYSMEHNSNLSMWADTYPMPDYRPPIQPGVGQGDDLFYLFDFGKGELKGNDKIFEKILLDMWINFGKTGNPTPQGSEWEWKEFDRDNECYMELDVTPTTKENYRDSWRPNGL